MGIMSNKVTRRVALGSIVGGLAGTALVLRALKGKYTVPAPENKYLTEWENCEQMLSVPVEDITGPSTVALAFKPPVGFECKMIRVSADYWEQLEFLRSMLIHQVSFLTLRATYL